MVWRLSLIKWGENLLFFERGYQLSVGLVVCCGFIVSLHYDTQEIYDVR